MFITQKQLSLIQNILNDFLWHSHARVKQSTACASVADGGLSMINVKNTVHYLRVKWVHHLCSDVGLSWSSFIWPVLTVLIPTELLTGL